LELVLRLRTLAGIPEMHDRILVAEALSRRASLLRRDEAVTKSGVVGTVW